MSRSRFVVALLSAGAMVLSAGVSCGQDYPNRPIRIVTASGGASFIASRLIADGISVALGQPVIVDGRGGGFTQQEIVVKAPPDGHTLIITGGSLWTAPLTRKAPYDPVRDFAPVSIVGKAPSILVVTPTLPVNSVKELIALAKARPGELNNSIGGVGGAAHLAGELFKSMAGINIVAVPYTSDSQEITDLLGGRIHMTISSPASFMEHVKQGKLKALAVTSAEPSKLVPGLPTIAETLPGYEAALQIGMFAPAKTPEAIIKRLNQETVRVLNRADIREKFFNARIDAVGSSPGELAAVLNSEMGRLGKLIKDLGIEVK